MTKNNLLLYGIATSLGLGGHGKGTGSSPQIFLEDSNLERRLNEIGINLVRNRGINANIVKPIDERILLDDVKIIGEERLPAIRSLCNRASDVINNDLNSIKQNSDIDECQLVTIGGDHSIAMASYAAIANHLKRKLGVVWIDAHADFHVWDTTKSKNIHGMALAAIFGRTLDDEVSTLNDGLFRCCNTIQTLRPVPEDIVLMGIRDLDYPEENNRLRAFGIRFLRAVDMNDVRIIDEIIDDFKRRNIMLHVSVDLDVLDPTLAPGVTTKVSGGLSINLLNYIAARLYESGLVVSLDIVEYNNRNDIEGQTADIAIDLILHFMGKVSRW